MYNTHGLTATEQRRVKELVRRQLAMTDTPADDTFWALVRASVEMNAFYREEMKRQQLALVAGAN